MTTLYLIGALMALVAMLFVALPLLRTRSKSDTSPAQDAANVSIYNDQLAELETDLNNGLLSQQQFDLAKPELERRLLQDVSAGGAIVPTQQSPRWVGIVLAILMPVIAIALYFHLGNPDAINTPNFTDQANAQGQEIEAMLPKIMQQLKTHPDDVEAWQMLGRAMFALQRFPEAAKAYEQITQIQPDSAQALADYADALGMVQGQKLAGKPTEIIQKALKLDPQNPKARYLAGFASIEEGDLKGAIAHWEKLLAELPPEQKGVDMLRQKIAELRQQAGMPAIAEATPSAKPADASASISGKARINAALKGQASPEDTLFIFARAVSGPKMPLALLRVKVKDLPVDFNLDDSMSMSPQMKLSNFPDVVIVARVSKSGTAITQPGDLEGVSAPVKLGARNVQVEISRKIE